MIFPLENIKEPSAHSAFDWPQNHNFFPQICFPTAVPFVLLLLTHLAYLEIVGEDTHSLLFTLSNMSL